MRATRLFREFFESEKTGGLLLVICTAVSLIIANTGAAHGYHEFWQTELASESIEHWINHGLMTVFFLLIGLELEREIYIGELSDPKDALLPTFAAMGGILFPAGIYLLLNYGTPFQSGAGIPMATDIAFALGVLSMLGNKVHNSLKVFLTAFAVIDDLGAIIIIAIFYSGELSWTDLFISLGIFGALLALNRLRVRNLIPYLLGGVAMWYFMLHSGVHATITGVLLAFAIPFGKGGKKSTSYILQHKLHRPVAFLILPVFALANTAITIEPGAMSLFSEPYAWGIALGLIVGKPVGIFLCTYLATRTSLCRLPVDLNWTSVLSVSALGGIGFTMSIFITLLAFEEPAVINNAKLVILVSSLLAGAVGYFALKAALRKKKIKN